MCGHGWTTNQICYIVDVTGQTVASLETISIKELWLVGHS
jgi:hypothetical protein